MDNSTNVKGLIEEIINTRTQESASRKDEVRVMMAMLNDKDFKIARYDNPEEVTYYCPAESARSVVSNVIHKTTKMELQEAQLLVNDYEFNKHDAAEFVNLSKEFVNTYVDTGRKFPLGCREHSNVALVQKKIKEGERTYPKKTGINEDGSDRYEKATTRVPAHNSIRVISSCPTHLK